MPDYPIGIEEEFFVSRGRTFAPARQAPQKLVRDLLEVRPGHVSTEMLQAQIEVNTGVCRSFDQAREELCELRAMLRGTAGRHGYVVTASGTHPMAIWLEQTLTDKPRYQRIQDDLQIVARRNVLCGLHVHVEVPEPSRRVAIMQRALPYLPLLLAFSLSSPFWQGHPTGLKGYRLSAYDELPRTGFPPLFSSEGSYDEYVAALVAAHIIPDASHLWWCIRPALSYPTLELRIADSTPRLDDVLCVAAWFRCLVRRLCEDDGFGDTVSAKRLAIVAENRWRVQRFGMDASLVDTATLQPTTVAQELGKLAAILAEDAEALGCRHEFDHWKTILRDGTAADHQLRVYDDARAQGGSRVAGLHAVMRWLAAASGSEK
jgi:carboxylate-amine ligase